MAMAGSSIVETAAAAKEEDRNRKAAEPAAAAAVVTKERVPDSYIERIKARPLRKMRPLKDSIAAGNPKHRERFLATNAHIGYLVDLEQDCLRQFAKKGYADIGVNFADGFKKVFILPLPQGDEDAEKGNNGGGGRSKTLAFVRGFAILLALLMVLLSCLHYH